VRRTQAAWNRAGPASPSASLINAAFGLGSHPPSPAGSAGSASSAPGEAASIEAAILRRIVAVCTTHAERGAAAFKE
jgi:hypothetical protein